MSTSPRVMWCSSWPASSFCLSPIGCNRPPIWSMTGACGTGGMLTVAEETLTQLDREQGKEASVHLYGQEVNPETYAISMADLILKGEGGEADNMQYGSTLSADAFPGP